MLPNDADAVMAEGVGGFEPGVLVVYRRRIVRTVAVDVSARRNFWEHLAASCGVHQLCDTLNISDNRCKPGSAALAPDRHIDTKSAPVVNRKLIPSQCSKLRAAQSRALAEINKVCVSLFREMTVTLFDSS